MCKLIIFVCLVAILYSLARSFLFPTREGISPPVTILTDFVTGAKNALESIFGKVKIDGSWVHVGANQPPADIELDDDNNFIATNKITGAKGRGHLNGDKIEHFQWLNQNGEPGGRVYTATLTLDHNKKVSVIPWETGGRRTGEWIRAPPQVDQPYCQMNVLNKCKDYPDVPNLGWFKDQDYGGPKPTTEEACEARRQSWIGSCGHQNVSMAFDSVLNHLLDKPVNIISVPYNKKLGAVYCWQGEDKCQVVAWGNPEEVKWKITKDGDKYNITSVPYNKKLASVYCGADQTEGCQPALWGNDTEVKWNIVHINDNVFEIKNWNDKNLTMVDCWAGQDKCRIAMQGNTEEVKWRIELADNAAEPQAPKPDEAPKPAGKCVPNVQALLIANNAGLNNVAAAQCPLKTKKEDCGALPAFPVFGTPPCPLCCKWVE